MFSFSVSQPNTTSILTTNIKSEPAPIQQQTSVVVSASIPVITSSNNSHNISQATGSIPISPTTSQSNAIQTIQYTPHSQIHQQHQQIPSIETIRTSHNLLQQHHQHQGVHHMPSLMSSPPHSAPSAPTQSQHQQIHVIRGPNDVLISSASQTLARHDMTIPVTIIQNTGNDQVDTQEQRMQGSEVVY